MDEELGSSSPTGFPSFQIHLGGERRPTFIPPTIRMTSLLSERVPSPHPLNVLGRPTFLTYIHASCLRPAPISVTYIWTQNLLAVLT